MHSRFELLATASDGEQSSSSEEEEATPRRGGGAAAAAASAVPPGDAGGAVSDSVAVKVEALRQSGAEGSDEWLESFVCPISQVGKPDLG